MVPKKTLTAGTFAGPDTDCVAGNEVKDALMWPLSTKEANAVNTDLRTLDSAGETQRRRDGLGLAGECRAKGDRRADPLAPA